MKPVTKSNLNIFGRTDTEAETPINVSCSVVSDLWDHMDSSQPVALLSIEFSRQECWSRLPFPSPGVFPTQGSNSGLPHCRYILYHLSYQGSPIFWPPDVQSQLIGKDLMLGKIEGRRRRGQQRMRQLVGITNTVVMNLSKLREIVKDRESSCAAVHGVAKSWTGFSGSKITVKFPSIEP